MVAGFNRSEVFFSHFASWCCTLSWTLALRQRLDGAGKYLFAFVPLAFRAQIFVGVNETELGVGRRNQLSQFVFAVVHRHVETSALELRRQRCGKGFAYRDGTGKTIRDEAVKARIKQLAVPPPGATCSSQRTSALIFRPSVATPRVACNIAITPTGTRLAPPPRKPG